MTISPSIRKESEKVIRKEKRKTVVIDNPAFGLVELRGFEPLTSTMRM